MNWRSMTMAELENERHGLQWMPENWEQARKEVR